MLAKLYTFLAEKRVLYMNQYFIILADKAEKHYEAVPHEEHGYRERKVPWA